MKRQRVFGNASGITLLNENLSTVAKGAVARISSTFNSGWQNSDIRRCYLSDITAESVSGTELVTNGDFSAGDTGWTAPSHWTFANNRAEKSAVLDGELQQTISASAGKIYRVTWNQYAAVGNFVLRFGGSAGNTFIANGSGSKSWTGTLSGSAVLRFEQAATSVGDWIDNISVKEVVADRSYKASSASITGTLTKSQVASNTSLVAYSGFSAANYLREPYSADLDLDFGTGEWSVGAWVNVTQARRNIFEYTEQFNNAVWQKFGVSITADATVAPNGTTTADKLVEDTAFGDHCVNQWVSSQIGVVASVYAKAAERNHVCLHFSGSASRASASFNLAAGTVRATRLTGLFTGGTATITSVGDGWYRCTFEVAGIGVASTAIPKIQVDDGVTALSDSGVSYTGDGTSGIFIWGAQLELGNTATAYQAVVTAAGIVSPICDRAHVSGPVLRLAMNGLGQLTATAYDGTTTRTVTTSAAYNTATWLHANAVYKTDGSLAILVNGQEVAVTRGNPLLSLNSRYNLLTKTEQFDDAAWTKANATITANATVAPDGTTTADKLVETAVSNYHYAYQSITIAPFTSYRWYVYAKKAERTWLNINAYTGTDGNCWFDLANGLVGTVGAGCSATISDVGNGWFRCQVVRTSSATTTGNITLTAATSDNTSSYSGVAENGIYIWGADLRRSELSALPYQRVNTATDFDFQAPLTIGNSYALDAPFPGSIALLKLSATAPTYDQAMWMYEQEKHLFRSGAQCVLPDSGSIVDLAYDDVTDKWIAVSATNESEWTGLVRTKVTAVPVGSYSKVSAGSGIKLEARTTTNPGVDVTIPAYLLREELLKDGEDSGKLSRIQVPLDYVGGFTATTVTGNTAITSVAGLSYPSQTTIIGATVTGSGIPASTTVIGISGTTIYLSKAATASASNVQIAFQDYVLPLGYEAKDVLLAGVSQKEGATAAFTRLFDGFRETIRFGTAPAYNALVQIQAIRSQT